VHPTHYNAPTNLPRVLAGFEGTWLYSSQLPLHALDATKPFIFNDKEEIFRRRSWLLM
jgi:hypothetical protein